MAAVLGALIIAGTSVTAVSVGREPRLGFIGVGTIATAMVRGLCSDGEPSILLGPRSARKAASLAAEFPARVCVAADNQAVLDGCDVVFLCVLPQQAAEVLEPLRFREEHVLVSVLSTEPAQSVARAARLPLSRVVRALPLPAVEERRGVTPLWPATHAPVVRLFERLGGVIASADERELLTLASTTCLVGQLYAQMAEAQGWLVAQGIPQEQAHRYVSSVYSGAVSNARAAAGRASAGGTGAGAGGASIFGDLVAEQTAGGINEQLLGQMRDAGALDALRCGLDAIHSRLQAGRAPPLLLERDE